MACDGDGGFPGCCFEKAFIGDVCFRSSVTVVSFGTEYA